MIVRSWRARATGEGARAYVAFFRESLVPELDGIEGHRGALVLTRAVEGGDDSPGTVEITVLTFWESTAAVARFAGATPERAVVEPAARAVLLSFDESVAHEEVAVDTRRPSPEA